MSRTKYAFETLLKIESEYPVNRLAIKDVHVWPLLRTLLREKLRTEKKSSQSYSSFARAKSIGTSLLSQYSFRSVSKQLRSFRKNRVDTVFWSSPDIHQDRFEGRALNRNIDPWLQFFRDQGNNVLKIEMRNRSTPRTLPRVEPTTWLSLPIVMTIKYHLRRRNKDVFDGNAQEFLNFIEMANKNDGLQELSLTEIEGKISEFNRLVIFFNEVVISLKPKRMFFVDFCSVSIMALTYVCRRYKVTTCDLQHGAQGDYHGYYAPWSQIPPTGYSVLPDFFWCWDELSCQRILKYQPSENSCHRPIVGGNLWLANWIIGEGYPLNKQHKTFLSRLSSFDRVILFSVSDPENEPLPRVLIDAIDKSPKMWLWLIRLHPQMKNQRGQIELALKKYGDHNVNIGEASEISLFPLLRHTNYHLTSSSSVGFEALMFKIPTVILHPLGKIMYEPLINTGTFIYISDDANRLIKTIKEQTNMKQADVTIEVDPKITLSAYLEITSVDK